MDFRGRAYPVPPHLSHLSRSNILYFSSVVCLTHVWSNLCCMYVYDAVFLRQRVFKFSPESIIFHFVSG